MSSHSILIIKTGNSVAQQRELLEKAGNPKVMGAKMKNFLNGCMGGARSAIMELGSVDNSSDPVAASKAGTFSGTPAASETISINGVAITFVDGAAGNNEVQRDDTPTVAELADRLADAINNSTSDALAGVVSAESDGVDTVTVSCLMPGVIGNSIVLADAAAGFAWAGAATALSGGSGRLPSLSQYKFAR